MGLAMRLPFSRRDVMEMESQLTDFLFYVFEFVLKSRKLLEASDVYFIHLVIHGFRAAAAG